MAMNKKMQIKKPPKNSIMKICKIKQYQEFGGYFSLFFL